MNPIDPLKVAELPYSEYMELCKAVNFLRSGKKSENFPSDLLALAFKTMRVCGADVKCHRDMCLAAIQFQENKALIEALRV